MSKRFGKIMQDKESFSINSADISISRSKQLDTAIPPSKIAGLPSGEFVGMVADNPDAPIELKSFHCKIINDHEALKKGLDNYKPIPILRKIDDATVHRIYLQIKQDVQNIINSEMERIARDSTLMVVSKRI